MPNTQTPGARAFELGDVPDEAVLLSGGFVAVDHPDYPIAKRFPYSKFRQPIVSPTTNKSGGFTLAAADAGTLFVATAALTVTVPIASALGVGFTCRIYADGAAVTISRASGGSMALAAGEMAVLSVANNKNLAYKVPAITVI